MQHQENVAWISTAGAAEILCENFMPYDLYLESGETDDIDVRMNNLANFYHWCASRLPERMTQREAAIDAVQHIGLRQLQEVDLAWFGDMKEEEQMFRRRLEELKL